MGRYAFRERRQRRGRGGCLNAFLALVFVGALLVLVYTVALRPMLTRAVAEQITGGPLPTLMPQSEAGGQSAPGGQSEAGAAVLEQAGAVLPDAVAALPAGELVVSEADVNGFLAAHPDAIAPLDSATVSFTGGRAVAQIRAFGLRSSASVSLAAQDGRLVVTEVRVQPPLSLVVSGPELASALADGLNAELATQGRRIEDVRIEEGQLVLVTS